MEDNEFVQSIIDLALKKQIYDAKSNINSNRSPPIFPTTGTDQDKYNYALELQRQKRQIEAGIPNPFPPTLKAFPTHLDNLIPSKSNSFLTQHEEENLLKLNKNIRKRKDGRYEWRKTVFGVPHALIGSNIKELVKRVAEYKKANLNPNVVKEQKVKESRKLIDLAWVYYRRHIESKVKTGKLKKSSSDRYLPALRHYIIELGKNIETYSKDDIIDFFNDIVTHRNGAYCYHLLRNIFIDETEKGNLKRNPIVSLKNPFSGMSKKGSWINIEGQRLIWDNLNNCDIAEEILFYILTGARREEALNTTINFERRVAFIDGTKTGTSSRYIELSPSYCTRLKKHWGNMFKYTTNYYSRHCVAFFDSLGVTGKSLHSLRHTFSSNHYYLGTPDVKRQYMLGHKSIVMTNDIYTTLDPSVTRRDIINIYGDLYPIFDPNYMK